MHKYLAVSIIFFLFCSMGIYVISCVPNTPRQIQRGGIKNGFMVMVYALGRVSGGHFNPAVTLAVLARNSGLKARDALYYWTMQFLGGAAGGIMYTIMEHGKTFPLSVGKGFGWPHVAVAEMLFTFLLCYVVLAVATTKVSDRFQWRPFIFLVYWYHRMAMAIH